MPEPIYDWPILPALKAYQTAPFDQRAIVLSTYRTDKRVEVGACPGLAVEWVRQHAKGGVNQSPAERMKAIDTEEGWEFACGQTAAFNKSALQYADRTGAVLGLTKGQTFKSSSPSTEAEKICVFFDPTNKFAFVSAGLKGIGVNHICAAYATTTGFLFKSKHLAFFDPNFGEFAIELTQSKMKAFLDAWIAQFATYRSGRTGKATKLTLETLEVTQLQDVSWVTISTRGRSGAVG
jgi:hypothetical protein